MAQLQPPTLPSTVLPTDTISKTPDQIQAEVNAQKEQDRVMVFSDARIILQRTVNDWKDNLARAVKNRKKRDVDVNVEQLRQKGELDEDETLVPVRVIDTNIQREQPAYINYLKNSRRITTFRSLDDPDYDSQTIELDFTRGMTYVKWETPHYKVIDGAATHGWDLVEVVYDSKYPLNCGIEHIGYDMLFFPLSNKDIQQCPHIIRAYDITINQLKSWVDKFGFKQDEVNTVIESKQDSSKANETIRIYKRYCKWQGQVYVSWFELDSSTGDWLKEPMALSLDIIDQKTGQDKPITQYPVFFLPYRETEKARLIDHKGRVTLDENKQEAQTAILSGFINKLTRSSNVYASRSTEDGTGSGLKEVDNLRLVGGRVLNNPVNFFSPNPPDPLTLQALQYFDDANSQETNQVNFAALNREDSRKTAKEIDASQQQQQLLNSVQLTLFSTFIREVYSFAWQIVQSQALQNKIKFLQIQIQQPVMNPMMPNQPLPDPQNPGQPLTKPVWVNDVKSIAQTFDIRAAGDVDVIQRQEKIQQLMQDWPVLSQTPLKNAVLGELIRLKYPDTGDKWAKMIEQMGDPFSNMQNIVGALGNVVAGIMKDHPEVMNTLSPQDQSGLQQLLQQAATMRQPQQAAGTGAQ